MLIFALLWLFLCTSPIFAQSNQPSDQVDKVQKAIQQLSKLRNLQVTQAPSVQIIDQTAFEDYIRMRLMEEYGSEIEYESIFLKTFHFMPQAADLIELYSSLSGKAATAFYDPKKNKMIFHQKSVLDPMVVLHESVHAIQSLAFGTKDWLDHHLYSLDEQLAHQSFLEGDAMVMMLWQADQSTAMNLQKIGLFARQIAQQITHRYTELSPYLAKQLAFPYLYGTKFVMYFLQKGWHFDQINALYRNPPISIQEIYQPSLYEQRLQKQESHMKRPIKSFELSPKSLAENFKLMWKNRGGQWHCEMILSQFLPEHEGKEACKGWQNDEINLFKSSKGSTLLCIVYQLNSAFDRLNLEKAIEKWNEISNNHLKMMASHQDLAFCIGNQDDLHQIDLTNFFSK